MTSAETIERLCTLCAEALAIIEGEEHRKNLERELEEIKAAQEP